MEEEAHGFNTWQLGLEYLSEHEGGRESEEEEDHAAGQSEMITPPPTSQNGLSKWTKKIHGKDFITYEGLLALAHEHGLKEMGAAFISVTETLALAYAWATFKGGLHYWEASDATPNNVQPTVKAHFPRIALTRAKARVLRDALNIGMVSVEELEE